MASREELEDEWREFQLWKASQSLDFKDYLEHRDLTIAKENMDTLREFFDGLPDDHTLTVGNLKELLSRA